MMCASLRHFQNCLQIDSSVNIKAVMMILVHIYALLWPYIRFVPKKEKSKQNVISQLINQIFKHSLLHLKGITYGYNNILS